MSQTNTLHDLAKRSLRALDEDSFPQLRDDLRAAIDQEDTAHALHQFQLDINFGGPQEATVYFSIEPGDTPEDWQVSEGAKVFYQGIEITELFEGVEIDEKIYFKSDEVETMIAEKWADAKVAEYESSRD